MNSGEGVYCSNCDRGFEVENNFIGEDVTCPYCEQTVSTGGF